MKKMIKQMYKPNFPSNFPSTGVWDFELSNSYVRGFARGRR